MAVPQELFQQGDVYIDYPQEEIMFRFDKASGLIYRKFYWRPAEDTVPQSSSLFMESLRYGQPTTPERYGALR